MANSFFRRIDSLVDTGFRVARSTETPPRRQRLVAAVIIASIACTFPYLRFLHDPGHPADFGLAWFGATALLHGGDPYKLIGDGMVYDWRWSLIYPATVMVVAMPFTILPQLTATMTFVWISSLVMAFLVTSAGWFRLMLFVTPSFAIAAGAAQWSPLLVSCLFASGIAMILAAKPNIGLVFWITGNRQVRINAIIGGVILLIVSLILLPSWPFEWIESLKTASYVNAPIARRGGFLILLALFRWRRRETWLIVALSCIPQTTYWYEVLPLFLIPASLGQIIFLAGTCCTGAFIEYQFMHWRDDTSYTLQVGMLLVFFVYLPAVLMILRRPNVATPLWPRRVGTQ